MEKVLFASGRTDRADLGGGFDAAFKKCIRYGVSGIKKKFKDKRFAACQRRVY